MKVDPGSDGRRAVDALRSRLGVTATLAKRIRRTGALLRNGAPIRMRDPVRTGDELVATLPSPPVEPGKPTPVDAAPIADAFLAEGGRIVFRDAFLFVVDKPAGWLSHPSHGDRRAVTEVVAHLAGVPRVHPVNRLDRGTSGLMAVALDAYAAHALSRPDGGRDRDADTPCARVYLAWVEGAPSPAAGVLDAPIARDPGDRVRRAVRSDGKPSVTEYAVVETRRLGVGPDARTVSLVRFTLRTGRTHQIRVHARHGGFPLLGDPLYGDGRPQPPIPGLRDGQALHAARLVLRHPMDGSRLVFESPLPEDMRIPATAEERN